KNMWQMRETDIPKRYGIFHELFEECNISKLNAMEKQDYEKSVLEYEDVKDAMKYHRKVGIDEGFETGMEKGRKENLRQMVAGMLKKGIDISTIAEISGMSEDQIAALQP
ncbi:MAG: hypothetical protein IJT51_05960, partial [Bacteroidales bacterium]|nr:hypothetical protein [Bacteroidales bacterium]